MTRNAPRKADSYAAPEAIAGLLAALGVPVAAVFGQLLLALALGFLAFGILLRIKRTWRKGRARR